ncbi:MAG: hypothetical protein NXH85_13860 [Pseudomonadaceae bacterium]|nr:hypothetical protein [Pseudomonadaceae bacterium]
MAELTLEEVTRWLTGLSDDVRQRIESAIDAEYLRLSRSNEARED